MRVSAALLSAAVLALSAFSCSSTAPTHLAGSWTAPDSKGTRFSNILVVGMGKSVDRRRAFENQLSEELRSHGVKSMGSLETIPPDTPLTKTNFSRWFGDRSFDGVIIAAMGGIQTVEREVDPSYTPLSPANINTSFYSYYAATYDRFQYSGQTREYEQVIIELRLFQVSDERLLWSGKSYTVNPDGIMDLIASVSTSVADSMDAAGLLQQ